MVSALIFSGHLIFALIVFTKKWQNESLSSAFLNLGLIGILFSVGWSITGMLSNLIMKQKGFGFYFDRDAFSLTVLCIIEYFFYKMYYKGILTEDGKGKQ